MRAIAAFFLLGWGTIAGVVFAGMFISIGQPTGIFGNLLFAVASVLFSSMTCIGFGRFINELKVGKIIAIISGVVISIVFSLRLGGFLPF